jgi:hypothetical protein
MIGLRSTSTTCAKLPGEESDDMLIQHRHKLGHFDPGHCRTCAQQADLLDHYHRVQREEDRLQATQRWARQAHRTATWALWASGLGLLLAAISLLTG